MLTCIRLCSSVITTAELRSALKSELSASSVAFCTTIISKHKVTGVFCPCVNYCTYPIDHNNFMHMTDPRD